MPGLRSRQRLSVAGGILGGWQRLVTLSPMVVAMYRIVFHEVLSEILDQ